MLQRLPSVPLSTNEQQIGAAHASVFVDKCLIKVDRALVERAARPLLEVIYYAFVGERYFAGYFPKLPTQHSIDFPISDTDGGPLVAFPRVDEGRSAVCHVANDADRTESARARIPLDESQVRRR